MRILKAVEKSRGTLAKTLYLQLDNCPRENKNTYIVAFCNWLVQRHVFGTVELSFLPVSHTHNECDQVASRISFACRHNDICTRADLATIIRNCYTPKPFVMHLDEVADFKRLVNPDLKQDFDKCMYSLHYRVFCLHPNLPVHTLPQHVQSIVCVGLCCLCTSNSPALQARPRCGRS
jgi:hypothetical protein